MKVVGSREQSAPPHRAISYSLSRSPLTETFNAAKLDAHAASVVIFLPRRLKTLAILPAITFDNSPGIESSFIGTNRES